MAAQDGQEGDGAMTLDIRPWRPGDETAIIALFETVFARPMTPAFWRWRFLDHPAGGPLIMLAWDGDRLAGHYAASHAPLVVEGKPLAAALSMTTMTHPDYRGRGLFEALGGALYEQLSAQGFAAIWGFPNTLSHLPFRGKLGWFDVCDVATMTLDLTQRAAPAADRRVVTVSQTDARFGALSARLARQTPIGGLRDAPTLAWRIDRNPVNRYRLFALEEGDGIVGYAVTKAYGAAAVDLVELRAEDDAAGKLLLETVIAATAAEGARHLHAWRLSHDAQRLVFERAGFAAGAPVTYFGGRALGPLSAAPDDLRHWRLSMLDSDIY